jgi:hypothetical protein
MSRRALWLAVLLLVVMAMPVWAQRTTGTIRGTVTDSTGAVVPGATVTATNTNTGFTRTATTNTDGLFVLSDLLVGTYKIEIALTGFKTAAYTDIGLNVADVRVVDVRLETGAISETISVESPAVAVQTASAEVAGLVTGEQARELPLNGRNYLSLVLLMPGVVGGDNLNLKDKGLLGGSDMSVSGNPTTNNMWMVDGVNNNDVGSNRTILIYPSVEAIEEVKVHRNSYGAEFGGGSGAQVNLVTRGGTNEFHGSAFYFGRTDALASKNYFLEKADQPKQDLTRNDFGATLGGPLIKDKLHFFTSVEWNIEDRGIARSQLVPTAAERRGDFSQRTACSLAAPNDPLTGQPFPGGIIPANRLSPGGQAYLQLFSLPNTTGTAGNCANWVTSVTTPIRYSQINARIDWSINPTTRLMLRYTQDSWKNESPSLIENLWGDDPFPVVDSNWDQPSRSLTAQLTHELGSTGTNTITFSYSGNKIEVTRGGEDPTVNDRILQAIPTMFPTSGKLHGADQGAPVFWGGSGYSALWNEAPFNNNQDLFVVRDDYAAVFGKHFLKVGVLASVNAKNEDTGGGNGEQSNFWGSTGLNGWGGTTGNILADFLLKDMGWGFSESSTAMTANTRWKDVELYVNDTWKVRSNVTLDVGVRYSIFFNAYDDFDKALSFDPALFNRALGNDSCNGLWQPEGTNWCQEAGFRGGSVYSNRSLHPQAYDNIAPRLGVAWDVNGDGKMAVRAGVGRFFLRQRVSPYLSLSLNPPFTNVASGWRYLDSNARDGVGLAAGVPRNGYTQESVYPSSWQWNVSVEKEIYKNTTLMLGYVGNRGMHNLRSYDINQVRTGDINNNGVDDRLDYVRAGNDTGAQAAVRPYGVFGNVQINMWDHSGDSIYHGLQTQLISRFWNGSSFQASYTWSRTIANESLGNSSGGLAADATFTDLDNPRIDRGLADTHRSHIANASLLLMLPSLADNPSSFVRNVFGDWQVTGIVQYTSGAPITVYSGGVPGIGNISGTGYGNADRPNVVAGQDCSLNDGAQILNPAAFTLNGYRLGTIGNSGRGVCYGPDFFQTDLALYKNIKLTDRVRLQLRLEGFNIFNTVNFKHKGGNWTYGASTVTLDNSDLSRASTIVNATPSPTFGQATQVFDPREFQFGIKLSF